MSTYSAQALGPVALPYGARPAAAGARTALTRERTSRRRSAFSPRSAPSFRPSSFLFRPCPRPRCGFLATRRSNRPDGVKHADAVHGGNVVVWAVVRLVPEVRDPAEL